MVNGVETGNKRRAGKVGSFQIGVSTIVVSNGWVKIARVRDEDWLEGEVVKDPETWIEKLKRGKLRADIFSFAQKPPNTKANYTYPMEWDNVAAIPIISFHDWWEKRLPQVTRKSVRRAGKRGVTARVAEFNDDLVQGIIGIHNDTPTRQGRPFAHYGKDFEVVKKEYGTYLDRSEFIAAYFGNELIGIVKLVWMGDIASIMEILSKTQHYDKRPTNVIIAKAVEMCEKRGIAFLVYGKYVYGKKTNSSLTEFKRRNGFEQIDIPRYYIPLTLKGRMIIKLRLHRGLKGILPRWVVSFLLDMRSRYYQVKLVALGSAKKLQSPNQEERLKDIDGEAD